MKIVRRKNRDFFVKEAYCPSEHSLIAESVRIYREPTIYIDLEIEKQRRSSNIDAF